MIIVDICAIIATILIAKIAYEFEKTRETLEDISQELDEISMKD